MPLRICFVASEAAPLAKTGGLADVTGALPRQLHAQGHDVRLFIPLYSAMNLGEVAPAPIDGATDIELALGTHRYRYSLLAAKLPGSNVPLYLVRCPAAYDRAAIYTTDIDEHLRFLILQRAALDGCQRLGFAPQILHCNDWHTALMPLLLKSVYAWDRLFAGTRTVLTIHNVGYQGWFDSGTTYDAGGDIRGLVAPETATGGTFNWLREGIRHADRVTTVSPTYAAEICTPLGGHGLDGVLRARSEGVAGILNGVDYSEWNPASDPHLPHHYTPDNLAGKALTKRALLDRFNLPVGDATPLIGVVSRLVPQKGFDLLFGSLPEILATRDLAFVALGSGEWRYESFFIDLQKRFPDRMVFHRGYSDELAHLIEGASDMFLMPSQYEPCGLSQMYSLKYGTVPIVRRTGGLADSVQHFDPATRQGTGVVFDHFDAQGLNWAVHTALDLYKDRESWLQMMLNGMAQDFSWNRQSHAYSQLYEALLA